MESLGSHFLVFNFLYNNMGYTSDIRIHIYIQGEQKEALSKRWEIEIHISYSGVSANADPERFICLNLCFFWIGAVFWDFQFHWLYPTFLIKKKAL